MISTAKKKRRKRKLNSAVLTKPPHLLCVDDDRDFQSLLAMRLRDFDVQFEAAFNGMHGVMDLVGSPPDLILMDLAMPKGDGEFLLDCVRTNPATADLPIIVLTGMRDTQQKRRVLSGGANVYLEKPIQFSELLHQLRLFVPLRRHSHKE